MKKFYYVGRNTLSLWRKALIFLATATLISVAFMFSLVLLVSILLAGLIAWVYLWWKTRELRKQMREHFADGVVRESEVFEGDVIEGEVIRDDSDRL